MQIFHGGKMKRIVLLTLLFLLTLTSAFGQFRVDNETRSNLNIHFENPSFSIKQEIIGAAEYDYVSSETLTVTVDVGSPELPFYSSTIEIPNSGNATINVEVIESRQIKDINIKPFRENDLELLTFNNNIYSKNIVYPQDIVRIGEPAIFRNRRVVSFIIQPFRYNDATKVLEVIEKANIEISFDNKPSVNEITRSIMKPTHEFEEFFASTILNYQAPDSRDDYQNPTILYIYPTAINGNPIMEGLFKWRREQGWIVHTAGTSETGTSSSNIKAYIQNAYNNWENPPAFVTFIGDADGALAVPNHNGGYDKTGDHFYGLLEGNDELEDIFLGRLSVSSTTDLATVVSKIIKYEKATVVPDYSYFNRALLVADTTPSGQSTIITNQYVKEAMLSHNEGFTFTELYGDSPSASSVSNALNTGVNFWNYRGWINMDGWGATQANALTNVNKLSITVLLTCSTGTYYSGTSVTEAVVRAGTSASPTGGVCSIGMATSGTHTAFNNSLNGGIMGHLFQEGGWTMGGAMGRGKHHLWEAYGVSKPDRVQIHTTLCNMIGDSSLRVYKGIPKALTAEHLENVPAGTNQIRIITKQYGDILPNAWVTLNIGDEYTTGFSNQNGQIYLNIPTNATGQGKLTITKEGYKPLQSTIIFGLEAPNINVGSVVITRNGVATDYLTPNATFELKIAANNVSNSYIYSVNGTISSGINGVAVTGSTASYGNIAQAGSVLNRAPYQISIANRAYENNIPINIVFSTLQNSWERQVLVPIKSPIIEVSDYSIANSYFGPGGTSIITAQLFNHGNANIALGNATLSSTDTRITVNSSETLIGAIPAGGTASVTFSVNASDEFLPGDLAPMTINIEDSGFETVCYFSLPIGEATITDPLGSDGYGYYIFDSFDVGYAECPVYNWVELNPAYGGTGTQINLVDNGQNQDNVQVVDLPFDFTFYGLDYDKISICSNGWIALGETEQATHRNWRLPGPLGPSPMIAPFWDDLVTGSQGKVYIAHNQAEQYFVVTWDKWKSAYNNSYEETFQVILYNPAYYMSPTGDAPIKIQYKVVNNVNNASGNEHGEYATVGIEDHTGTVGLEYTFNNQYPTAAKPLQNQLALFITTRIAQIAQFNGSGTESDPYQITELNDLITLSENATLWNKHFIQTTAIDGLPTSGLNEGSGFKPIGNNYIPFSGFYNGNGYTISDLYINRSSTNCIGLFGRTNRANISNVGLVDNVIYGNRYVGGLIGYSENTLITNCYATGFASGNSDFGNLIGFEYNTPTNPQNMTITMLGDTAQIAWDAVTEDINQNPVTPDMYVVYYSQIDTETDNLFYFLTCTTELSCNHPGVGAFSKLMFYRVMAYKDVDRQVFNKLESLINQKHKMNQTEIEKLIRK